MRVLSALAVLCALGLHFVAPAHAYEPLRPDPVDPAVAALLRGHACGTAANAAAVAAVGRPIAEATPDDKAALATLNARLVADAADLVPTAAAPAAAPSPSDSPIATRAAGIGSVGSAAGPPPATAAAVTAAATAAASPDVAGAAADPSASTAANPSGSPNPSASPSLLPIPPVPPNGPQEIVPPTPRPLGSPTSSPVPLPTTTPVARPSGPVFLVRPSGTPPPIVGRGASPLPQPSASAAAGPAASSSPPPTLGPNEIVTIADRLAGSSDKRQPSDLYGNVHIFYSEGQVVGDRAHFDGDHTLVVSGHTYLVNRSQDSILYADRIAFDTLTRRATLENGAGETIEGVQRGKLHYTAQTLTARTDGISHGDRASFSTCENPHAGYHVEARSIDVTPGSKIVARKAVVFLGPTAIFYLPLLVIPLVEAVDQRRQASFIPIVGYNKLEGFFIKARVGFAPSETYYGYYRLEYFTKRGLGLGYVAFLGAQKQRRYTTIDSYTIGDRLQNARHTNIDIAETENFNRRLRGQFGFNYVSDYGANLSLPATVNLTGSVIRQGNGSTENLTFSRFLRGPLSDNLNVAFTDNVTLTRALTQQLNVTYSKFNSQISSSNTLKLATNTHLFTRLADYNLTYEKTDYSANPFGYDRVPEFQILPHLDYGKLRFGPQLQFTVGKYTEPQNHFSTTRAQAQIDESVFFKVLGSSDFSAHYNLVQDYYGTGDAKAYDQQNAALSTPIGDHFVNSITYNEQHPIGPANVPFQLFDRLSSGSHSAQETMRVFNRDYYSFQLATGTGFNRQAQAVNYQLSMRPSRRSYVILGGYYQPGPGLGFNQTNVQAITPFGRDTTLELTTNVDWKNHARLTSKNIYITRTVDECYNIQGSYNQDLKQFSFNFVILAFPGQSAGFGFGGQKSPIIPQNFAF
ncbi:MAG: hypothetical protein NVSMB21_18550 [Vulcanimicrobiaceae bacterium]